MSRRLLHSSGCPAWVVAWLLILTGAAPAPAQDAPPAPAQVASQPGPAPAISPERLQSEIALLTERLEQAPEQDRQAIASDLEAARAALERAGAAESERADFERRAREAPTVLETIRSELAAPPGEIAPELPEAPSVSEVEQALAQANAEAAAAKAEVQRLEREGRDRADRLTKVIPEEIAAARGARREILDSAEALAQITEPSIADQARLTRLRAELHGVDRRIARLEAEQQSYLARESLLPARLERAKRRATQAEALIVALQARLAEARRRQAARAAEEAARLSEEARRLAEASPTLREIAEENVELTSQLTGPDSVNRKLERIERQRLAASMEIRSIRERFARVSRRIEETGLTDANGVWLHRELDALQSAGRIRAASLAKPSDVSDAQLRLVELEARVEQRRDPAKLVARVRAEVPDTGSEQFRREVEQIARDLIEQRTANLIALKESYETYVNAMADLQSAERTLIQVSDAYRNYIEERILWVRSIVQGRRLIGPRQTLDALRWLFLSPAWLDVPPLMLRDVLARPLGYVALLLLAVVAFPANLRARRGLRSAGDAVASFRTDHFSATLMGVFWTVVLALPFPLVIYAIGRALRLPPDQAPVALATGAALERVATAYLLVEILRYLLRPGGVGDTHFRWRKPGMRLVRANLLWFVPLMLPGLFVMTAMREQETTLYFETLGRLSFIYLMVVLAVFAARVLSPRAALIRPMLREGGWMERLRFIWYPAVPGVPLLFAVLSLLGYFYSAFELAVRLRYSMWFILAVAVAHAMLLRWLYIARRRLAVEQARKARVAAIEAARKQAEEKPRDSSVDVAVEEKELDIPAMDQQTRRLFAMGIVVTLAFGLLAIWSNVLPALNMLERVQLWPRLAIVQLPAGSADPILAEPETARAERPAVVPAEEGAEQPTATRPSDATTRTTGPLGAALPSGASEGAPGEERAPGPEAHPITLADVGLALVIALVTVLAGRNLPGLLEIAFLQRLPLDAGSRFAISTVSRYAIFIIGLSVALGALNIGWSKVQWLAAALTFGLAFGLQEIFANFVSGLIILAERPVRVGDTVTVGDVSGTVARIQMRATTITEWDRKELIVPNKSFITDQVINWSLSSTILRITVEVGVAYGSDVEKARQLLYEAAAECDLIIDEPEPRVFFLGFGDNSLTFRLNAFIASIDNMLSSRSALHFLINRKFNEAGISIAFPQRDVHLDSLRPIDIRIVDAQGRTVALPGAGRAEGEGADGARERG